MSARELITEHLDLWTGAVTKKSTSGRGSNGKVEQTGIKKLRELILELAVRGKLLDQSQGDEPANELHNKILDEKDRQIIDGKIKKPKELPAIEDSEQPFRIPASWKFIRLSDAVEIVRGITFPASEKSKSPAPGRLACLRTSNVQKTVEVDDMLYIKESFVTKDTQYIRKNDIVMSMANSRELVGKVAFVEEKPEKSTTFGGFLGVLRPTFIHPKFLMAVLRAPNSRATLIGNASQTTNIANISIGKLNPLVIGLPPIKEQHRIVQKVDELMALCDRLEQQTSDQLEAHETLVDTLLGTLTQSENATQLADNWARLAAHFDTLFATEQSIGKLKQTILQLAVMGRLVKQNTANEPFHRVLDRINSEEIHALKIGTLKKKRKLPEVTEEDRRFQLPEGWDWVKFDHIASPEASALKAGPFGSALKKSMYVESGYKIYGQEQVIAGSEEVGDYFISEEKYKSLGSCRVRPGDILISLVGTIGKVLILSENCQPGIINPRLVKLSLYKDIHRKYISLVLSSPLIQAELSDKSHGGTMNILNLSLIRNLSMPIPPVAEQQCIVQKVNELMALCDQLKERLNQAGETRCQLAEAVVKGALN